MNATVRPSALTAGVTLDRRSAGTRHSHAHPRDGSVWQSGHVDVRDVSVGVPGRDQIRRHRLEYHRGAIGAGGVGASRSPGGRSHPRCDARAPVVSIEQSTCRRTVPGARCPALNGDEPVRRRSSEETRTGDSEPPSRPPAIPAWCPRTDVHDVQIDIVVRIGCDQPGRGRERDESSVGADAGRRWIQCTSRCLALRNPHDHTPAILADLSCDQASDLCGTIRFDDPSAAWVVLADERSRSATPSSCSMTCSISCATAPRCRPARTRSKVRAVFARHLRGPGRTP